MRPLLKNIYLFLVLAASPCLAQTSTDLSSKYGAPVQSYEVRPGIFAIVRYAADGQACEMRVERRHVRTSGTVDLSATNLSTEERRWIVDELAPPAKRGEKLAGFDDIAIVGGGGTETEEYENVSVTYYSNFTPAKDALIRGTVAIVIEWKNSPCKQG